MRISREGKVFGWPSGGGSKKKSYNLSVAQSPERRMRSEGKSYYKISRVLNVHPLTSKRFCQAFVNDMPDLSADSIASRVEQMLATPAICAPSVPRAALPPAGSTLP